jgi:hypothetical protein
MSAASALLVIQGRSSMPMFAAPPCCSQNEPASGRVAAGSSAENAVDIPVPPAVSSMANNVPAIVWFAIMASDPPVAVLPGQTG